ncbi:hypothetical protein MLD38_039718 [Melastoma candidum]|uniref:Uncharacterized protein n=1 Tax=Melastoma candidum TaxID=119954 RepID=A0ACB9L5C0_9MYRT|nr:hypothetical protein MLD38_039718 [Melastoma candidum]
MTGKRAQPTSPVGSPTNSDDSPSKEQDKFLPIANVSRIMKKALPANAKISKEAKETVQECVSEFISFITGEASDKCQREKRKTINGDDLLWAMTTLGFENYVGSLKVYLNKYRETEGDKNNPTPNHGVTNLSLDHDDHHGFFNEMNALPEFHGMNSDIGGGVYGINFVAYDNMNRHGENGDGNANRAMASQIHNGVMGW